MSRVAPTEKEDDRQPTSDNRNGDAARHEPLHLAQDAGAVRLELLLGEKTFGEQLREAFQAHGDGERSRGNATLPRICYHAGERERALASGFAVASQPSLRTLRVLRRISHPYQTGVLFWHLCTGVRPPEPPSLMHWHLCTGVRPPEPPGTYALGSDPLSPVVMRFLS